MRLTLLDCVQTPEVEQSASEKFRTLNFLPVIDQFEFSLTLRLEAYQLVDNRFGFSNKLDTMSIKDFFTAAKSLVEIYNTDIDEQLGNELIQFKKFYNDYQDSKDENISRERWMHKLLLEKSLKDCFLNVKVVLRMYLSFMITYSNGERSFSKLRLIKNRHRTSMLEKRLIFFTLLSFERYFKAIKVRR